MPFRSVVLAVLAALGLQAIPAREASTPGPVGARIKGRVVDAGTKAPVSGARVQLRGSSQRGPVLTKDDGVFEFEGLPAGTYSFAIERNGYLWTSWPESQWVRQQGDPVELGPTDSVENVTLPLARGGVVAGKVRSAAGEPISGAEVMLVPVAPPTFSRRAATNDLGEYRVADLPPGRYVLKAQLRPRVNEPSETPLSGPLPTYYPGTLERGDARDIVVGRNGEVTEGNLQLIEGMHSVLRVTVKHTDGRVASSAILTVTSMEQPPMRVGGLRLQYGVGRLELPPGQYTVEAQAPSGRPTPNDQNQNAADLTGTARVRLTPGARETVTVVAGLHARASGRVFFESDGSARPPASGNGMRMFAPAGQPCRDGSPTVASDWSFTIDGLEGTCRPYVPFMERWLLKSVIMDGAEVLDEDLWFEPGRHYENVRIVMTDRQSRVRVRVRDADGTPTGEYAAVVFSVERARWRNHQRYIRAAAPLRRYQEGPIRRGTGGDSSRSMEFVGFPPGDYYLIAVDNIEHTATREPWVLEKLARLATRVTIPERDLVDVPLQRYLLNDVLK